MGACQQLRGTAHVGGRTAIERSSVKIVVRRGYGFLVNPTRMGSLHDKVESGKMVQRHQGNDRKANQEVAKGKGSPKGGKANGGKQGGKEMGYSAAENTQPWQPGSVLSTLGITPPDATSTKPTTSSSKDGSELVAGLRNPPQSHRTRDGTRSGGILDAEDVEQCADYQGRIPKDRSGPKGYQQAQDGDCTVPSNLDQISGSHHEGVRCATRKVQGTNVDSQGSSSTCRGGVYRGQEDLEGCSRSPWHVSSRRRTPRCYCNQTRGRRQQIQISQTHQGTQLPRSACQETSRGSGDIGRRDDPRWSGCKGGFALGRDISLSDVVPGPYLVPKVEIRYYDTDEPAVNFGDAEREFCQLAHDKTSPWHYKTVGDYNESSYNEAQAVYIAMMMAHEVEHHGGSDDLLQDSFFHEDHFDEVFDMLGHHYVSEVQQQIKRGCRFAQHGDPPEPHEWTEHF